MNTPDQNPSNQYRRKSCIPAFQQLQDPDYSASHRPRSNSFTNGDQTPFLSVRCRERCPTPFNLTPRMDFQTFNFDSPIDMFGSRSFFCKSPKKKIPFRIRIKFARVAFALLALFALITTLSAFFLVLRSYFEDDLTNPWLAEPHPGYDQKKYDQLMSKSGKLMKFKTLKPTENSEEEEDAVIEKIEQVSEPEPDQRQDFLARSIPTITGKIPTESTPVKSAILENSQPENSQKHSAVNQFGTRAPAQHIQHLLQEDEVEDRSPPQYDREKLPPNVYAQKKPPSVMKMMANRVHHEYDPEEFAYRRQYDVRGPKRNLVPPGVNPDVYYRRNEF